MSSHRIRTRSIRRIGLGLAVAAALTPSALASLDPSNMPCAPTCPSFESAVAAYGELQQFPGAGVELALPDDRAIRPTIIGGPSAAVVEAEGWKGVYRPSAAVVEAEGWKGIYRPSELPQHSVDGPRTGPATNLPTFSIDAPRTAPDAIVRPAEPVVSFANRGGRVPVGQPVGTRTGDGTDMAWPETAVGIGIGLAAALALAAALGMTRRRGTLQGA
jgi:hypothetical protein